MDDREKLHDKCHAEFERVGLDEAIDMAYEAGLVDGAKMLAADIHKKYDEKAAVEPTEGTVAWIQVRHRDDKLWDGPKLCRLIDVWGGYKPGPTLEWWEFGEDLSLSGGNEVRVLRVIDVGEPPEFSVE